MLEPFGWVLAGLGLSFAGTRILGLHMKQLAGRGFRQAVSRYIGSDFAAGLWGAAFAAVTQNAAAVFWVVVNLVATGAMPARRAFVAMLGCTVGVSLIVLVLTLPIKMFAVYLMGMVGVCYGLNSFARHANVIGAVLGLAMLYMGMVTTGRGAVELSEHEWVQNVVKLTHGACVLAFLAGAGLRVLTQSSVAVVVVALALAKARLLDPEEIMSLVYGVFFGAGLNSWLLAGAQRGLPKQLTALFCIQVMGVSLLFSGLLWIEHAFHLPLIQALLEALSSAPDRQVGILFVMVGVSGTLLVAPGLGPLRQALERRWPPPAVEAASRPQFVTDDALADPPGFLDLAGKEQQRLLGLLPNSLDALRGEPVTGLSAGEAHAAIQAVCNELDALLHDLASRPLDEATLEQLATVHSRQDLLRSLDEAVYRLATHPAPSGATALELTRGFAESLHLLLTMLAEAASSSDAFDRETLLQLTGDRGDLMGKMRQGYLAGETGLAADERAKLLGAMLHFERAVWLIGRFART